MRIAVVWVVLAAFAACKKEASDAKPAEPKAPAAVASPAGTSAQPAAAPPSDGVRRVAIEANKDGYTPAKIPGKPGEKLMLVFTRTFEAECIAKLKAPDGQLVDLPMNKPVEVAVTVPQTGEVAFACGMDMFHGVVVAQPGA
jgi:plastocyanin domain-containing protein